MLSGKRPFAGVSPIDTMSAILKEDAADLPATVPPGLESIVRRCLEKRPDDRFESARDLAFALESVSSGSGREKVVAGGQPAKRVLRWAAAAATAVVLVLAGWLVGRSGSRMATPQFQRVTYRRGMIPTGLFSNDGKTIIYSAAWDGKPYELFSTEESSTESRPLSIQNAFPVSISKNGEMALILTPIVRWAETPGTLARAPVSGGAPREIADGVFLADWSPDGSQLAVTRGTPTGQKIEYPIGKKLFENNGSILVLKVSPKGDRIGFINNPVAQDAGGYATIVDTEGKNRISSRRWNFITGLAWSLDGSEVWFTAGQRSLMTQLYAMDLKGHERTIASLPGAFYLCDIGGDGRLLLMQISQSNSMFYHSLGSTQNTDLYWHDISQLYALSSDGKEILFIEGGNAAYLAKDWPVYVRKTDGSPAVRLGEGYPTAFSPDGNWAMVVPRADPAQLLALPLHAGDAHSLTADAIHHVNGRWLPDGKRIVFVGAEPQHRPRYYVQDSMQATPKAIT